MSWTTARARVAGLSREHDADSAVLQAARRDLRAERLAEHVRQVVSQAPPLTDEQRSQIVTLLNVGGAAA